VTDHLIVLQYENLVVECSVVNHDIVSSNTARYVCAFPTIIVHIHRCMLFCDNLVMSRFIDSHVCVCHSWCRSHHRALSVQYVFQIASICSYIADVWPYPCCGSKAFSKLLGCPCYIATGIVYFKVVVEYCPYHMFEVSVSPMALVPWQDRFTKR
jgi:hypothetical protein